MTVLSKGRLEAHEETYSQTEEPWGSRGESSTEVASMRFGWTGRAKEDRANASAEGIIWLACVVIDLGVIGTILVDTLGGLIGFIGRSSLIGMG